MWDTCVPRKGLPLFRLQTPISTRKSSCDQGLIRRWNMSADETCFHTFRLYWSLNNLLKQQHKSSLKLLATKSLATKSSPRSKSDYLLFLRTVTSSAHKQIIWKWLNFLRFFQHIFIKHISDYLSLTQGYHQFCPNLVGVLATATLQPLNDGTCSLVWVEVDIAC